MTETTITRFQIGAEVPSWLIDQEPVHQQSVRGRFTFATSCDVIDTPDCYVVLPLAQGPLPSIIEFDGAGVRIFASGKPVRLIATQQVFYPQEIDGWAHQIGAISAPGPRKKPGLWARVRAVFG